ncbi:unnamed protein product [Eruca vesicaria subsp. sativa]|uniref:RNase H type-1 domain-containing protein n=1 Tax=Eruca vesicaria subsp. sativa TaxID=29727 RepID=A0ABC8J9U2_ERUVS|nr:unnamed protein product [Eruca vesicaria subsp. sativa]
MLMLLAARGGSRKRGIVPRLNSFSIFPVAEDCCPVLQNCNARNERISSHHSSTAFVISSLVAEGLAIRAAMESAIESQMSRVIFESDSLQLVTAIVEGSNYSEAHGILSDIYHLSTCFESVSFRFCRRDRLCFEDTVAKNALANSVLNRISEPGSIE